MPRMHEAMIKHVKQNRGRTYESMVAILGSLYLVIISSNAPLSFHYVYIRAFEHRFSSFFIYFDMQVSCSIYFKNLPLA